MRDKFFTWIKENYLYFVILLVLVVVLNVRLPYVIYAPGGIKNMDGKFEIKDTTYPSEGSFNLVYVTEYKATIPLYLWALIRSDWEIVPMEEVQYAKRETMEEIDFRSDFYLKQANQNALYYAYHEASKKVDIKDTKYYILYIDDRAKTSLKIGDEIRKIDGIDINTNTTIKEILANKKAGDLITILVCRDGVLKEAQATLFEEKESVYLGVSIGSLYELDVSPELTFHFDPDETGSSAGLVTALSIYNALTKTDITHGKKIVCTGTIDMEGNVGAIGSVVFKLHAAVKNKADIFMVPLENYEEVKEAAEKYNYKIDIYPVKTLQNALEILSGL